MKKVLLVSCLLSLVSFPADAAKLCKKSCATATWKSNGALTGSCANTTGADSVWTFTVTAGTTGTISGRAICSGNNSTNPPVADGTNGQYCWCQITSASATGYAACSAGPWVFSYDNGAAANCRAYCAGSCANSCVGNGALSSCSRSKLFQGL